MKDADQLSNVSCTWNDVLLAGQRYPGNMGSEH